MAAEGGAPLLARRAHANAAFAAAFLGDFEIASTELARLGPEPVGPDLWEVYDGGIREFTEGWMAYWRGDLVRAEQKFDEVVERHGTSAYAPLARVMYVWVACAMGDPRRIDRAELVRRGVPLEDEHGVPWGHYAQMATAKLLAARRDAPHLVASMALEAANREHVPTLILEAADLLYRADRSGDAVVQLRRLSPLDRQPAYVQVGALVLNALVQRQRGEDESAHRLLEKSLALAVPMGIRRAYDPTTPGVRSMLAAHAARGTAHPEFVAESLASHSAETPWASVLSVREQEVLQYMRGTLSNMEIAAALHVSVNTVKTHQRSIYRKLDVSNRREAVRLANDRT